MVTIWFGLNDSAGDVSQGNTSPRVPIDRYEENLRHFVGVLRSQGARPILLTPNPVAWTPELKRRYGKPPLNPDDPDGYNVFVKQYAGVVRKVAAAWNVPLVDVYRLFDDYARSDRNRLHDLTLDGMHPNDRGHRMIADHLVTIIRPLTSTRCKEQPGGE